MKSMLKEVEIHSGVTVEIGEDRIECKDEASALKLIRDMGYSEADIVFPDGSHTKIKRG